MLVNNKAHAQLWLNARDILTSAGIAAKDVDRVLAQKPYLANGVIPQEQPSNRAEIFAPVTAPRMNREILPGSVPLIPLGGMTLVASLEGLSPTGLLTSSLRTSQRRRAWAKLLDAHFSREHELFNNATEGPMSLSDAEQFYCLRDTINYLEQWMPGDCLQYPALIGILGVAVAIDECLIFSKDIPSTRFVGITVSEWESKVRAELERKGGDSAWLDIAFSGLYGCICLQNLEKAMLSGVKGVKTASMEWQNLNGYLTRCEIALVSVVSFFLAAYSGGPYRE